MIQVNNTIIAAIGWDDIGRGVLGFAFVAVLGGAAGLVWGLIRHRRELDLAALADFRQAYGRWFAIWKSWEAAISAAPGRDPAQADRDIRNGLIRQAADIEGVFEALLVKIATERRLNQGEIRRMARFRESYQELRNSMKADKKLPFRVQYDPEHVKAYLAFKVLSIEFSSLLGRRGRKLNPRTWFRPSPRRQQETFVQITSWRSTGLWWEAVEKEEHRKILLAGVRNLHL
jgi:hypothetical protein